MLCKKHDIEEFNLFDCESCGLEIRIKQLEADKERLDFLDSLNGKYTGKIILRMSSHGRGFRLHETSQEGAAYSVRETIDNYIKTKESKDAKK